MRALRNRVNTTTCSAAPALPQGAETGEGGWGGGHRPPHTGARRRNHVSAVRQKFWKVSALILYAN